MTRFRVHLSVSLTLPPTRGLIFCRNLMRRGYLISRHHIICNASRNFLSFASSQLSQVVWDRTAFNKPTMVTTRSTSGHAPQDEPLDSPPPYHLSRILPPNSWRNYKGLGRYHSKKGPEAYVHMSYRSNPTAITTECTWAARVVFHTKDLPGLMHRGLFLRHENVDYRKNYCRVLGERESPPFTHARYFEAKDISSAFGGSGGSGGDCKLWTAKVSVYAYDFGTLGAFRLQDLAQETVYSTTGLDTRGRPLYKFSALRPGDNFNAIFDDLPLPGMWPWPKVEEVQDEDGERRKRRWSWRGALGLKKSD